MKLYLIRHGQAVSNISDVIVSQIYNSHKAPLTSLGVNQSLKVGENLANKNLDLIFSSDFLRTMQTAYLVGAISKTRVGFDTRLREKNMGDWEGRKFSEFVVQHNVENLWEYSPDKVESYQDIVTRAQSFLDDVQKMKMYKSVGVVSHGDILLIIKRLIEGKQGKDLAPMWGRDEDSFGNADVYEITL
jgi:broad specificity phosphatase PhoE